MNTTDLPIRFTYLKACGRSPAHAKHAMDLDLRGDSESSEAMKRGTAVHAMLFGTARVMTKPEGAPKKPSKAQRGAKKPSAPTLAAIEWWDAFELETRGALVLSAGKYEAYNRMADAVRAQPMAMDLFTAGVVEETIRFDIGGRACRTTPDACGPDFVAELKTAKSSHPVDFMWQSKRMGYHAQHSWHRIGAKVKHAYTVAVEATAPYVVTVFKLDDADLDLGDRCVRLWFEQIRTCEQSNQWPGYAQSIVDLKYPESDDFALTGFADDEDADPKDDAD